MHGFSAIGEHCIDFRLSCLVNCGHKEREGTWCSEIYVLLQEIAHMPSIGSDIFCKIAEGVVVHTL
jgi:hypothetical protein